MKKQRLAIIIAISGILICVLAIAFSFSVKATNSTKQSNKSSKEAIIITESGSTNSSDQPNESHQVEIAKTEDGSTRSAEQSIESSQVQSVKTEDQRTNSSDRSLESSEKDNGKTQAGPTNSADQPIESSLVEIDKTEIWNTINGDGIVQTREMVQQGNIAKEYDSSSRLVRYENSDLLPPTEETNEDDWIPSKDVWQSFQSEYADQIANLGDFVAEGITKLPADDGWFFNMVRPIGENLYDRVILETTRTGQVVTLQVFYADLDSVPSSFVDYVQNAIEEYAAANEPDAVSYEPDISYEKLEDGRIIARCSLIFQYSDGSSWGENISIVSEDPYY